MPGGTTRINAIRRALRGEIRLSEIVAAKRTAGRERDATFPVDPEIIIDNQASNRQTLLQVSANDRLALLYDLTVAIARLNLNIATARVVTFGEKAVDTFYVTDLTGAKILDENRQNSIRRHIMAALAEPA